MSNYEGRYHTERATGGVYTLVVRIDYDGEEFVCRSFPCKTYASKKNAERAVARYIAKLDA